MRMNWRVLAAVCCLSSMTSCSNLNSSLDAADRALLGKRTPVKQIFFDTNSVAAKRVLPKFTYVSVNGAEFGHTKKQPNFPGDTTDTTLFSSISAIYLADSSGNTRQPFTLTRTYEDVISYNRNHPCQESFPERQEVTTTYPGAVVLCEQDLVNALENAQQVAVDGKIYTNWPRTTLEYLSAAATIIHF